MPRTKSLRPATPRMRQALTNRADNLPADNHCQGRSEFGGFNNTRAALIARGWMTADHQITDAGREVIGRTVPADLPAVLRCFACDRPIKGNTPGEADTRDAQVVFVGADCLKRIQSAGEHGYQPPKGGPRLFPMNRRPNVHE